ncbi:MAG: 4,5-dihydroxyphthalate decarboxylase [Thermodesulfobacteriota bacterium]
MPKPKLTLALAHYDRHVPFFDGSVQLEDFELEVLPVGQSAQLRYGTDRHERMLRNAEFDACEVSLSSYLMAKSRGWPFIAIPIFPRRLFSLSMIWVNADAGIQSPKDLVGRRVGLNKFQTTLSVLTKGDLQTEYDVPWRSIHWITRRPETVDFRAEEGVKIDPLPEGKKIGALLVSGEIDALIMPHPPREVSQGSDRIRRLFSDSKGEERAYFQKAGFYPIMHLIVFKANFLNKHPQAAARLMEAFESAKAICREYYSDPNWSLMAWGRHLFEEERRLLGADPWPYGYNKNKANLERFIGYSLDQGLLQRKLTSEELFWEKTLGT